ncbi:MAG: outer membrane lipoprotein-sorting protein [Verrucomicrobia bacterium]|nr:outer membrane lipoprotein-sorting protein [Verrucomicrobiota bacterium]
MRRALLILLAAFSAMADETAEPKKPAFPPEAVLQRVWNNRAQKDFSLQARLFIKREQFVPVDILIKNLPEEVRTVYRSGTMELLVVHSQKNLPRYYLAGTGELTGARRMDKMLGSWISYYDLGLPFLYWPEPKHVGQDRMRGQDCYLIEVKSETEPYRRVKLWVHTEYFALLRAEAFDVDDNQVKRIAITSFKRIGEVWIPRGMDFSFVPPGQSLPASERSRLEIHDGNYDARLPLSDFDPARFGAKPSAASN